MSTFAERKAERSKHFETHVKGWASVKCGSCNGSGRYDHNGSPACGWCDGSGKEMVAPSDYRHPKNQQAPKD